MGSSRRGQGSLRQALYRRWTERKKRVSQAIQVEKVEDSHQQEDESGTTQRTDRRPAPKTRQSPVCGPKGGCGPGRPDAGLTQTWQEGPGEDERHLNKPDSLKGDQCGLRFLTTSKGRRRGAHRGSAADTCEFGARQASGTRPQPALL